MTTIQRCYRLSRSFVHSTRPLTSSQSGGGLARTFGNAHHHRRQLSSGKPRTDPTAKRPNKMCDPYGQGGKPLSRDQVEGLLPTIHSDWQVEEDDASDAPDALRREFVHTDFLSGARFISSLAAVAQMNAHFPSLTLERRIARKNWQTVTAVRCHTLVLGGLSTNDFHLAMVSTVCLSNLFILLCFLIDVVFDTADRR